MIRIPSPLSNFGLVIAGVLVIGIGSGVINAETVLSLPTSGEVEQSEEQAPTGNEDGEEVLDLDAGLKVERARTDNVPEPGPTTKQIVDRTNAFRKAQGLEPVQTDDTLTKTAQSFADFMARTDKYGHQADGRTPAQRAEAQGYEYCLVLENIAWQYSSAGFTSDELSSQLFTGWKESPGHRKNMLNPRVTETGVAIAYSKESDRYYAVQLFGRPRSLALTFQLINPSDYRIQYRVGGQVYTLEPDVIRTHTRCDSSEITYPSALAVAEGSEEKTLPTTTLEPSDGIRYRFNVADKSITLSRDAEIPEDQKPNRAKPAE